MPETLPIAAVIPTRNRADVLERTLNSVALQDRQPTAIIVIDSSDDERSQICCETPLNGLLSKIIYEHSDTPGAASQRNQASKFLDQPFVLLMDDDIVLDPDCIQRLWLALQDPQVGGASAMISNQHYTEPSRFTRWCYRLIHGSHLPSYAGRCLGPSINLLPEDDENLPEVVPVEWLNSTCTLYRREGLPDPIFPSHFTGYSMFEDVTLSLTVGTNHKLVNARTARIFHDSQPGDHKSSLVSLTRMEINNRHYVTTHILGRRHARHLFGHAVWQAYKVIALLKRPQSWKQVPATLAGTMFGLGDILLRRVPS